MREGTSRILMQPPPLCYFLASAALRGRLSHIPVLSAPAFRVYGIATDHLAKKFVKS
jgi:hypothetical protein